MVQLAANIWADGPATAPQQPSKGDIREWGTWVEQIIGSFTATGGKIYSSLAALTSDLSPSANAMVWVLGDPVAANNGIYRKVGNSGVGSWVRASDLPFSFIIAVDSGAGTANAIKATSPIPVSNSALIWFEVSRTNTASPITISFNGGSALQVKTNSGNDVAIGGLPAGMVVLGILSGSGSIFRLVSDQASSAIIAQAETYLAQTQAIVDTASATLIAETEDIRDAAQAAETQAQTYAAIVGAAVYDFNFDSNPSTPGYDWNS